ncbi:MAG: hypothetical protein VW683_02840 [Betaproteobacteria bacterium]
MPVVMLQNAKGMADESGAVSKLYEKGDVLDVGKPWQRRLADLFISAGLAEETKVVAPAETKGTGPDAEARGDERSKPAKKRARRKKAS